MAKKCLEWEPLELYLEGYRVHEVRAGFRAETAMWL